MLAFTGLTSPPLFYKAKRLSSICSVFLRLLLDELTGGLGSPEEPSGETWSADLARSSRNLSNSKNITNIGLKLGLGRGYIRYLQFLVVVVITVEVVVVFMLI